MRQIGFRCHFLEVVFIAALQVCIGKPQNGVVTATPKFSIDFNCLGNDIADAVIEDLLKLTGSLQYYALTGSVKASGWQGWHQEHEVWRSYVKHVFRHGSGEVLAARCPLASEALSVARWGACFLASAGPATGGYIRYLGCFKKTSIFTKGSGSRSCSQLYCAQVCRGRDFFALEAGGNCLCDEHFKFAPEVQQRAPDSKCGGAFGSGVSQFISVYALSVPPPNNDFSEETLNECQSLRVDLGAHFRSLIPIPTQAHELLSSFAKSRFAQPVLQFLSLLRVQVQARQSLLDPDGIVRRIFDCPAVTRPQVALDDVRGEWSVARVAAEAARAAKRMASSSAAKRAAESRHYGQRVSTMWPAYLIALTNKKPTDLWLHSQVLWQNQHQCCKECVMGYLTLTLEQLVAAQTDRTRDPNIYASSALTILLNLQLHAERFGALAIAEGRRAGHALPDSLAVLLLTRWPVLQFLIAYVAEEQAVSTRN